MSSNHGGASSPTGEDDRFFGWISSEELKRRTSPVHTPEKFDPDFSRTSSSSTSAKIPVSQKLYQQRSPDRSAAGAENADVWSYLAQLGQLAQEVHDAVSLEAVRRVAGTEEKKSSPTGCQLYTPEPPRIHVHGVAASKSRRSPHTTQQDRFARGPSSPDNSPHNSSSNLLYTTAAPFPKKSSSSTSCSSPLSAEDEEEFSEIPPNKTTTWTEEDNKKFTDQLARGLPGVCAQLLSVLPLGGAMLSSKFMTATGAGVAAASCKTAAGLAVAGAPVLALPMAMAFCPNPLAFEMNWPSIFDIPGDLLKEFGPANW